MHIILSEIIKKASFLDECDMMDLLILYYLSNYFWVRQNSGGGIQVLHKFAPTYN